MVNPKGTIKIENFEKIDGKELNFMGAESYELEFKATVIFLAEAYEANHGDFAFLSFMTPQSERWSEFESCCLGATRSFNKDQKIDVKGKCKFEKKDSGWSIDDIRITSDSGFQGED